MANVGNVKKTEKDVTKTIVLEVPFEYKIINGEFETPEDEAHYNKYAQYLSAETPQG